MLKLIETERATPIAEDAKRILGSMIHFGNGMHRCAYCGSAETRITALDIAGGSVSAQIVCSRCLGDDRPIISEETLKLILMHA